MMAIMARATRSQLAALWQQYGRGFAPQALLGPETGLVRLTTQAGQSGPRFQFGEATVSRCLVEMGALRGYAVHLGSDQEKVRLAACLDLLFQADAPDLLKDLATLELAQKANSELRRRTAEASKVRFYTTKTSTNTTS